MAPGKSSVAVNNCIRQLSYHKHNLHDTAGIWGEVRRKKPPRFATPIDLRALFSVMPTRQHQRSLLFKFLITAEGLWQSAIAYSLRRWGQKPNKAKIVCRDRAKTC